jgi:hypothetical protein
MEGMIRRPGKRLIELQILIFHCPFSPFGSFPPRSCSLDNSRHKPVFPALALRRARAEVLAGQMKTQVSLTQFASRVGTFVLSIITTTLTILLITVLVVATLTHNLKKAVDEDEAVSLSFLCALELLCSLPSRRY